MNYVNQHISTTHGALRALSLLAFLLISACSSDLAMKTSSEETEPTGDFEIRSSQPAQVLIEGDAAGLRIPLSLTRNNGHDKPVELQMRGRTDEDVAFVTSSFSRLTLTPSEDESEAVLKLSISASPIQPQQRDFIITASDGVDSDTMLVSVNVQPTAAPDVYLLVGQSNMVGFSMDGTRQSYPGGEDEPNPRIKQLNVSRNDMEEVFLRAADYTSPISNIVAPDIVTALDPLHVPQDSTNDDGKESEYIGLGLSFAKRALLDTSADIVLVPAAWSGSSFCSNDDGPQGNWMPQQSSNSSLGNTLLFERAVTRANLAIERTGGVLRGILWHQGESDANERCAPLYAENLKNLAEQLRARISPVGNLSLQRVESAVPFVVGTMSRGTDERGDLSVYMEPKQMIDDAHRNFPSELDVSAVSNHDDLVPANGYPCGNSSCIHFGPSALREMGRRYYEAMSRALQR